MASFPPQGAAPPSAPPTRRRLRMSWGQGIGLGLLALLPIAAVFDGFGTHEQVLKASSADVALTVEHAPRVRYGSPTRLKIQARALRGASAGPITVRVDSEYLDQFMQISMFPAPDAIHARSHLFVLPASDAENVVVIELEPEHYGTARGHVSASVATGSDPAQIALHTFAFP